ncbi:MAG TPA: hypothetical protein VMT44_00125 [Methanoregula sp.]|nr:hypothetical protein [Methanoregula sp.]
MKEKFVQDVHLTAIILLTTAIGIVGFVAGEAVTAALLITGIVVCVTARTGFRDILSGYGADPELRDDAFAIIAAAFIVLFGTTVSVWLMWVVALAVFCLVQQSVVRLKTG